ncbi:unnamed protein product [Symbiodinium sp. CCMP2592]|nr:unnamed protein product [Symbiodinium sp. CCMP2592]
METHVRGGSGDAGKEVQTHADRTKQMFALSQAIWLEGNDEGGPDSEARNRFRELSAKEPVTEHKRARQAAIESRTNQLTEYLNQYFRHSRRRNAESINDYVTRKSEIYMRVPQALNRIRPHQEKPTTGMNREWGSSGRRRSSWTSEMTATTTAEGDDEDQDNTTEAKAPWSWKSGNYYGGWSGGSGYWSSYGAPGWWSSSSSWGWPDSRATMDQGSSPNGWNVASAKGTELLPEWVQGWYLLQDANLSTNERNMVYTALKGEFTVIRVAQELRNQWTEGDLKKRDQHYKGSSFLGEADVDDEVDEPQDAWYDDELNDEGTALVAEAEDEARQAWAVLQNASRTLKEARSKQHQVRMSRKYYQSSGSRPQGTARPRDDSRMTCLKCGLVGHRAADCPGPSKAAAHEAEDQSAPFVCYAEQALLREPAGGRGMTTAEAVQAGCGVIDGGATRTLGSVSAIEAVMKVNSGKRGTTGVQNVDVKNRPVFGFADSGEAKCVSTIDLGLRAGQQAGNLRVHALDKGTGPILVSVATRYGHWAQ